MKKIITRLLPGLITSFLISSPLMAVNMSEKSTMESARIAFEKGQLDQAINFYEKIPQSSDYWMEALEERAWTAVRKGDHNKALALVTTLTSDLLAPQIGPEPYFLKALLNYKLCHIVGVMEDFQLFKTRYQSREVELEKLVSQDSSSPVTSKALNVLKQKKSQITDIKADDFGADIKNLPRYFYRDTKIISAVESGNESDFKKRLSGLASLDLKEIKGVLQKMQVLETQVVQQVFAYNKEMQKKKSTDFSKKVDKNALVFPYSSSNEIWLDEIDSFDAATAECPLDPFKRRE